MWEATAFFLDVSNKLGIQLVPNIGIHKGGSNDPQKTGIPNADSMFFFGGGVVPPNPREATSEVKGLTLAKDQAFQGAGQWFYMVFMFQSYLRKP